jgi:hypothetical protein
MSEGGTTQQTSNLAETTKRFLSAMQEAKKKRASQIAAVAEWMCTTNTPAIMIILVWHRLAGHGWIRDITAAVRQRKHDIVHASASLTSRNALVTVKSLVTIKDTGATKSDIVLIDMDERPEFAQFVAQFADKE